MFLFFLQAVLQGQGYVFQKMKERSYNFRKWLIRAKRAQLRYDQNSKEKDCLPDASTH